ncbi:MAG: hypothetical protein JWL70_2278 [Acidimicrobiia bacterium]|nr:hypothetical protein [Acidimicrobiia bacterium]
MGALEGRVAIITGGGRGLGEAYARRFAQEGAKLVINSVTPGADGGSAQTVVDSIVAEGGEAVAHVGSVSSWGEGERLVQLAVDTFGRLDVLVNNAGFLRDRLLANMSEEEWDSVVDVHLKGQFVPLRFAAAYWRDEFKAGRPVSASVINTTAGAGLHGNAGQTNYGAAKAGAAAITLIAAQELARYGVRVNAISPLARTRLTDSVPGLAEVIRAPDDAAEFDAFHPDNVAPLAVYLASADCPLTGEVFDVQGCSIGRYRGWTVTDRFESDGRWSVDALAGALAPTASQA